MSRPGKWFLFGGLCLLYISFPLLLIQQKQRVVRKGTSFEWETSLSRPEETYRGYYLPIDFPAEYTFRDSIRRGDFLYAQVRQVNGIPQLEDFARQRPESGPYMRARVRYRESDLVILDLPTGLSKVYIPKETYQKLATEYEKALLDDRPDPGTVTITLYVWKGRVEARLTSTGAQG